VAWKWSGEKSVQVIARPDFKDKTDKSITKKLHSLINEADITIAHNGDAFDNKKSHAKFIEHGLTPPKPYKSIDTKKVAKKYFKFNSNSLNDLGHTLNLGKKLQTGGFDLWVDCMAGKAAAWQKMKEYNKQDVILLEKVYLKLRPWIKNHPNLNLYQNTSRNCPNCGSARLKSHGWAALKSTKKQRFVCKDCRAHSYQATIITN
jgi:hypothetical protein